MRCDAFFFILFLLVSKCFGQSFGLAVGYCRLDGLSFNDLTEQFEKIPLPYQRTRLATVYIKGQAVLDPAVALASQINDKISNDIDCFSALNLACRELSESTFKKWRNGNGPYSKGVNIIDYFTSISIDPYTYSCTPLSNDLSRVLREVPRGVSLGDKLVRQWTGREIPQLLPDYAWEVGELSKRMTSYIHMGIELDLFERIDEHSVALTAIGGSLLVALTTKKLLQTAAMESLASRFAAAGALGFSGMVTLVLLAPTILSSAAPPYHEVENEPWRFAQLAPEVQHKIRADHKIVWEKVVAWQREFELLVHTQNQCQEYNIQTTICDEQGRELNAKNRKH